MARLFGVDPRTVHRWAQAGHLQALKTLGGHRRYHRRQVAALLGVPITPEVYARLCLPATPTPGAAS